MSVDRMSVVFGCPLIDMPLRRSVDRYRRREQHFWLTALTADAALPAAVNSVAPALRRGLPLLALALGAGLLLPRAFGQLATGGRAGGLLRSGLRPYRVLHPAEAGVRQASDAVIGIELAGVAAAYGVAAHEVMRDGH